METANQEFYNLLTTVLTKQTFPVILSNGLIEQFRPLNTSHLKNIIKTIVDSSLTQSQFNSAILEVIKETYAGNSSDLFDKLMRVFNENQKRVFGFEGSPLHDPVTIAYLMDPSLLEVKYVNCEIDISQGSSYGRTNCDIFGYLGYPNNTYVAVGIDVDKFWDIIEESIKRY